MWWWSSSGKQSYFGFVQSPLPTCFARKATQGDDKEFFDITLVTPPIPNPPKKRLKLKSSIRIPRRKGLTCICISNSVQSKFHQLNNYAVNLLVMTTSERRWRVWTWVTAICTRKVCRISELLRQLRTIPTRCATCHPTLAGLVNSRQSHNKSSVSVGFALQTALCPQWRKLKLIVTTQPNNNLT